ncbi:T9SS type A sorting domain-containing protein [Longitalea luteola]|uniref:T9SS type A sorting domain-containing protein n=1 Tax=Longitalea luteola TaxID=2812563 RepID=UPI001A958B16|nr:T9SS type A sorting domain-containing protein [Longitalea luteola]
MKKVTSTLLALFLCLYLSAQVGTLDETFNPAPAATPGYVINNLHAANADYGKAIATHLDGRIVVATYTTNEFMTLVRYLPNGTLDASFGTGGIVNLREDDAENNNAVPFAITVLNDNSILVAGFSYDATKDFALLKLQQNGTPDPAFGTDGWVLTPIGAGHDEARAITVQSDGKILVAGFSHNGTNNDFAVVRYEADGDLDGGFGTGGIVTTAISGNDEAAGVAVQQDGKIIVGGTSNKGPNGDYTAVRYNANGTLDNSYGTGGIATIDIANGGAGSNDECYAMILQVDGKLLMTGESYPIAVTNNDIATIRLTTTGIPDATFNGDGNTDGIIVFDYATNPTVNSDEDGRSIALQSDGKIIIGGGLEPIGEDFRFLLLRYNTNGILDAASFDGDGIVNADLTADEEFGYAVHLYDGRIYLSGGTGDPRNFILAAFENDGTPLPLVLSNFYANKLSNKVQLQWQTSSEENVKQFIVERSNDGKTYKAIGQVAASGNSSTTKNYTYTDQSPFMSANNYYRLLMQDIDGNYKYSKTVIIKFDDELSANLQLFPNPVKDVLQVQIPNGLNGTIGLQIIDMNGRVIKRNNFASDGNALNTPLDVSTLVKGVYILKVQAGSTTLISRFTKN